MICYTIIIWDRQSPNFDANKFVRKNGTRTIKVKSKSRAFRIMEKLQRPPGRYQCDLNGPDGKRIPAIEMLQDYLSWLTK